MSPNLSAFAGPSARAFNLDRGEGIKYLGKVGDVFAATASSTAFACPVTQAVSAGTTIFVYARGGGGTSQLMTTASDSKGNTYVLDVVTNNSLANVAIYSCFVTTALTTSDTITVNYLTLGSARNIAAFNFSGIVRSNSSRLADSGFAVSASNQTLTTTLVTTFANRGDLVLGALGIGANNSGAAYFGNGVTAYGTVINPTTSSVYAGGTFYISPNAGNRNLSALLGATTNWALAWASYRAVP